MNWLSCKQCTVSCSTLASVAHRCMSETCECHSFCMHWVFIIFLACCCCCILLSPWLCHIHRKIHRKQLNKSQNFSRHASREWPSSVSLIVSPRKRKITTKAMHDSVPSACKTGWSNPPHFSICWVSCVSHQKSTASGAHSRKSFLYLSADLVSKTCYHIYIYDIYIYHIRIYTVIIVVSIPLATMPEWISLIHVDTPSFIYFPCLCHLLWNTLQHSADWLSLRSTRLKQISRSTVNCAPNGHLLNSKDCLMSSLSDLEQKSNWSDETQQSIV